MKHLLLTTLMTSALILMGCSQQPGQDRPAAEVGDVIVDTEEETAVDETAAPADVEEQDLAESATFVMDDDYTYIGFTGSKSLGGVNIGSHFGQFSEFDGTVTLEGDDITTAKIKVTMDTTAMTTDNAILTNTLKDEGFFDVENHPTAVFESTAIEATDDGYRVTGTLALKGTRRSLSFPADISLDGDTIEGSAEFNINRHDWGIDSAGWTDNTINDSVLLTLELVANRTE